MKPEQLTWTDKQWAAHLGCPVQEIPSIRKYITDNFHLGIYQRFDNSKKYIEIQRRHDTPSGSIRFVPVCSSESFEMPVEEIVQYTNNKFIPSLELNPVMAKLLNVPQRALQMLHIKER